MIRQSIKQTLLNNFHFTNFQYIFFTGLHFTIANSSSSSMNVIEMKFQYCSSTTPHKASFFTALPHFLSSNGQHHPSSSLAPSSLPAHSLLQLVSAESTSPTGLQSVNCFNWSSLSQLLPGNPS